MYNSDIMITRIAIPQRDVATFCQRNKINRLSLFVSVLRDDFGPDSDVDALVEFEADAQVSYFDLVLMQDELGALLGREIDLATPAALSEYIRGQVLASMQTIYASLA